MPPIDKRAYSDYALIIERYSREGFSRISFSMSRLSTGY